MTNHKIQFVGSPCGLHGNYTFYKAFKYNLHGKQRILSLGDFFFVKIWEEEDIISVGEAQLLWEDRTSGQILVSLRIYFLPENTPDGRCDDHGEHEVVSLSEKVVLRAEDVIGWMRAAGGVKWDTGLLGVYSPPSQDANAPNDAHYTPPISGALDIKEIMREKKLIGDVVEPNSLHIVILAFDKYCRMRALLKRLEGVEEEYMRSRIVVALGGFVVPSRRTRMLFCRDVFDYPELEGHDLLCNHLSPKLQGRPRKKKRKTTDSESESSETSEDIRPRLKGKPGLINTKPNGLRVLDRKKESNRAQLSHSKGDFSTPALNRLIEADFMSKLHKFMKDRNTPITRIPHIGYRQLNVFELFTSVQKLGGFEAVTDKKLWKLLYDEMSGSAGPANPAQNTQSFSSIMKRHYERLLLPYEKFLLQEQKKLLGIGSTKGSKVKSEPGEPSVSILQQHVPSDNKASLKLGDTCPKLLPPHVPPGHLGGVTEVLGLHSGNHPGSIGAPPTVGTPPRASPAPPASVSPPTTPTELTVPKVNTKKEGNIPADLAKRPEITITPIPRSHGGLNPGPLPSPFPPGLPPGLPPMPAGLSRLQLEDLINIENLKSTLGMSTLQDLAKIAEKHMLYDRYENALKEPAHKKMKTEDGSRVNGASSRDRGTHRPSVIHETHAKAPLPAVPGLVSADVLRQMNLLDSSAKLLLPAHQSNKTTISALASLLPQTSIFPAPAPLAHQHNTPKSNRDPIRPEPPRVFQSPSVYSSQSKHVYGKPTSDVTKDLSKDSNKSSSPEIEILDLSRGSGTKNGKSSKSERPEIELLDLSTRRDITVSAISKPGPSKNSMITTSSRIPPPHVSIKSSDQLHHHGKHSPLKHPGSSAASAAALAAAAAQSLPGGLAGLQLNPAALLPYLTPMLSQGVKPGSGAANSPLSLFPYMDPATLAAYYSMLPHPMIPTSSSGGSSGGVAAAQQLAAAQLQLSNSLGLSGLSGLSPDALSSLGMYKNFLPQGNLPPPHFLSGLMNSHNHNPPTSK